MKLYSAIYKVLEKNLELDVCLQMKLFKAILWIQALGLHHYNYWSLDQPR